MTFGKYAATQLGAEQDSEVQLVFSSYMVQLKVHKCALYDKSVRFDTELEDSRKRIFRCRYIADSACNKNGLHSIHICPYLLI